MVKNDLILSPFFFGLFFLILIAFISEFRTSTFPMRGSMVLDRLMFPIKHNCLENCRYWCIIVYGRILGGCGAVTGYSFNPRVFFIVCLCCTKTTAGEHVTGNCIVLLLIKYGKWQHLAFLLKFCSLEAEWFLMQ
ncbi:hypothetical protein MKW98_005051 [Papaver atlanticum]|uniref:Uncharacterized protein n=1 Tax=Papaver atlanticum TaxID=357466 RepID=A0AAD4XWX6_9MAGN|nr:hypothetical protein MKW98_005051 [Papaver atlanticum]